MPATARVGEIGGFSCFFFGLLGAEWGLLLPLGSDCDWLRHLLTDYSKHHAILYCMNVRRTSFLLVCFPFASTESLLTRSLAHVYLSTLLPSLSSYTLVTCRRIRTCCRLELLPAYLMHFLIKKFGLLKAFVEKASLHVFVVEASLS